MYFVVRAADDDLKEELPENTKSISWHFLISFKNPSALIIFF
jgi:hypothetical protein